MAAIVAAIGGIGFFLLGMNLMADGLKAIAGDSLRNLLNRFTGGVIPSITTGTIITLLVQSSTATSLMTIGFVSAGMLTFAQATGVILGANLGTTSTGWIVAFIGLKYSISQLALPIVGIGVILKQFSKGKWAHLGHVLSGLGLIFVGIQFLQDGMSGLNEFIDLTRFPEVTVLNRFILVVVGIVMTIIMQSSSAAIATTITVLATGGINLEQAIALVIGQNIGTTATVAIAAVGASVSAKRTALSHILFNVITGTIAFIFFPLLIFAVEKIALLFKWTEPAVIVALFNTSFSLLGIFILAPFIKVFTKMIKWLLPEKKSAITQHLDRRIIPIPSVATETAIRALKEAGRQTLKATLGKFKCLSAGFPLTHQEVIGYDQKLTKIKKEMKEIQNFAGAIRPDSQETTARYTSLLHALDHLQRLNQLVRQNLNAVKLASSSKRIYPVVYQLEELMMDAIVALNKGNIEPFVPKIAAFSQEIAEFRRRERAELFKGSAKGEVDPNEAFQYVKLILFLDGLSYHLWRMMHHMSEREEDA